MNDKLFRNSSPFEDLKKLNREYGRLSKSVGQDINEHVDHAINFALTAWHLTDKVFNYPDTNKALEEKGCETWKIFFEKVYRLCPELQICHDLSIIYKHYHNSTVNIVKSAKQASKGGISKVNGVPITKISKINGVPISQIKKINGISISPTEELIIETKDGIETSFMKIAESVKNFWQEEIESLNP